MVISEGRQQTVGWTEIKKEKKEEEEEAEKYGGSRGVGGWRKPQVEWLPVLRIRWTNKTDTLCVISLSLSLPPVRASIFSPFSVSCQCPKSCRHLVVSCPSGVLVNPSLRLSDLISNWVCWQIFSCGCAISFVDLSSPSVAVQLIRSVNYFHGYDRWHQDHEHWSKLGQEGGVGGWGGVAGGGWSWHRAW